MKNHLEMEIIGQTIDDAAGEAFDKCAKVMGISYPGGPLIDQYAAQGNPKAYNFARARIKGLDFSFSGLKTSFLYFLRGKLHLDKNFIAENRNDLCASLQDAIIDSLMQKLTKAARETGIRDIAVAGGVSANSGLRDTVRRIGSRKNWRIFIPEVRFATDNAAMIAITGYYKYLDGQFSSQQITPVARFNHL
jgi:N6-L-threonylcarbamoyladenine synthase